MKRKKQKIDPVVATANCISHIKDLIKAAKIILEHGFHNIAFHLVVLALEELSIAASLYCNLGDDGSIKIFKNKVTKKHDDRLAGGLIAACCYDGTSSYDPKFLIKVTEISKIVQRTREEGLYFHPFLWDQLPKDKVTIEQVKAAIELAEKGTNFLENHPPLNIDEQTKRDYAWLRDADSQLKKIIYSDESIEKYHELKRDVSKWIRWLRTEHISSK